MPEVIQQLDEQALVWIAEHVRCAVLDPLMKVYTQMGTPERALGCHQINIGKTDNGEV